MKRLALLSLISMAVGMTLSTVVVSDAHAVRAPRPIATDPRIKTILYSPNEVFKFTGYYGYQSSIEFGPDEQIVTISVGDSTAWMMNPSGNRLFLKPTQQDATTNMTLITDKRTYLFELHAGETENIGDRNLTFALRFIYPSDASEQAMGTDAPPIPDLDDEPGRFNFRYSITGSDFISPIRIFDDGEFTYFEFRDKNAEVPGFFLVDAQGNEAIVNYRTRGDYIVLERVASRLTLRHGGYVVCVYNEAMPNNVGMSKMPSSKAGDPTVYPVPGTEGIGRR